MALTLFIVSIAVFLVSELAPGDVARHILGQFATPEQVELLREQMGLNQPVYVRYFDWLIGNDWRHKNLIDKPLVFVTVEGQREPQWYAVAEDGTLLQWRVTDDQLVEIQVDPIDGTRETVEFDGWQLDEDGKDEIIDYVSQIYETLTSESAMFYVVGLAESEQNRKQQLTVSAKRARARILNSSAVFSRTVLMRQSRFRVWFSYTPITVLVLPTSITSSMIFSFFGFGIVTKKLDLNCFQKPLKDWVFENKRSSNFQADSYLIVTVKTWGDALVITRPGKIRSRWPIMRFLYIVCTLTSPRRARSSCCNCR